VRRRSLTAIALLACVLTVAVPPNGRGATDSAPIAGSSHVAAVVQSAPPATHEENTQRANKWKSEEREKRAFTDIRNYLGTRFARNVRLVPRRLHAKIKCRYSGRVRRNYANGPLLLLLHSSGLRACCCPSVRGSIVARTTPSKFSGCSI
jgi:hypothetical protein